MSDVGRQNAVEVEQDMRARESDGGREDESLSQPIPTVNLKTILSVASAGPMLVLFAFTVPLTTLTSTATALGAGAGAQAWILSAMSVGAAAGLLSSGAVGDDYGRRRTFVWGAFVLALSSLLGALAPNATLLVIARIVQGLGGAAILACSLGLIGHVFPDGAPRANAAGVWAAALGAGVAIGPLLSAGLDQFGGWWLPYVLTGAGAVLLGIAGQTVFPESRAEEPRRIDIVGTLLLSGGLALVLGGLVEGRTGWGQLVVLELVSLGVVLLVAFAIYEHWITGPMLDLSLFRRPAFIGATVAALAAGAGVLSLVSFVPTLLERAMGVSTLTSAVLILAWSATSVFTAFGARWLPERMTPRARLIAGLIGVAIGQLALFGPDPAGSILLLLPGLLIAGIANGMLNAALGYQAVASVPSDRAAMGSGANNTARYLGSAMGLAIVTVFVAHGGESQGPAEFISGWNDAVLVTAAFSLAGAAIVWIARHRHQTESI